MIGLSSDPKASPMVRARADAALRALAQRLSGGGGGAGAGSKGPEAAQRAFLAAEIERYLKRPEGETARRPEPPEPPPGQPIGMGPEGLSGCSLDG
jgi:hypothetical protein